MFISDKHHPSLIITLDEGLKVGRFAVEVTEQLPRELVALAAAFVPFEQPPDHDERYRAG